MLHLSNKCICKFNYLEVIKCCILSQYTSENLLCFLKQLDIILARSMSYRIILIIHEKY